MFLWAFVMAMFITGQVFGLMLEGDDPLLSTTTSIDIPREARAIPVVSTTGWPSSGKFFLEAEEIDYIGITSPGLLADLVCQTAYLAGGRPLSGDFTDVLAPCFQLASDGQGRGLNRSDEVGHASGALVMSPTLGLIGTANTFDLPQVNNVVDVARFTISLVSGIVRTIPKMIMWDYSFLEGNAFWIKLFMLYPLSFLTVMSLVQLVRR